MKKIKIDLSDSLENIRDIVLSLPPGGSMVVQDSLAHQQEIKAAIRRLYETAHGRQVETCFGWMAIAPPVASSVKAKPLYVETQTDFMVQSAARIVAGPWAALAVASHGTVLPSRIPTLAVPKKQKRETAPRHLSLQPAMI